MGGDRQGAAVAARAKAIAQLWRGGQRLPQPPGQDDLVAHGVKETPAGCRVRGAIVGACLQRLLFGDTLAFRAGYGEDAPAARMECSRLRGRLLPVGNDIGTL